MKGRKNIHVLHVVSTLGCGGMEVNMWRKIAALRENMTHTVVCLTDKIELRGSDNLAPIACMRSRPNDPRLPERLHAFLRKIRPSLIHSYNWGAWPDVAIARLGLSPPIPMVFSFHGLDRAMPLRRRLAFTVLARITPHLLTVCNASKHKLVREYRWPISKISVIYNGVDVESFYPPRTPNARYRLVVGSAGGLREVKNHQLLIGACAELRRRGIDVEVRIAGEGPLRNMLLDRVHLLGMGNRVRLMGRLANMPDFYRRLDVFVLPSLSEENPNALLEAMATGLPCVATDVGSVNELLDTGRCGVIVPSQDKETLADRLEELINDPHLRRELGEAARARACGRFAVARMLDEYRRLYTRLASNMPGSSCGRRCA